MTVERNWTGVWTAAMMRPAASPWHRTWATEGFDDHSVRQVIRLTAGGTRLRIRLSNRYGARPLRVAGVTVGLAAGAAAVRPGSMREARFGGCASMEVPAGASVASDPVEFTVDSLDRLIVTLYLRDATGPATHHHVAITTTYRAHGDHRRDTDGVAFSDTADPVLGAWYYLEGVEVVGGPALRPAIVAFGESTTDGVGSTPNGDDRYPDALAERLVLAGRPGPVLNAGIGGNKLLADSMCVGEMGVARFARDVLDQPGAGTVIVSIGMNDILRPGDQMCGVDRDDVPVTLERLIDGHRELICAAHERGVTVMGGTLLPFGSAPVWTRDADTLRREFNRWVRLSGEYDSVVDFERAIDPEGTGAIPAGYHIGDHLHPSPLGYEAMADAALGSL